MAKADDIKSVPSGVSREEFKKLSDFDEMSKEEKRQLLLDNINKALLKAKWLAIGSSIERAKLYCYIHPIWTANAERVVSNIVDIEWPTARPNTIKDAIYLVKRKNLVEPDKSPLGTPTSLIAFKNTVIDTKTFEECQACPAMFLSNIIPHKYIRDLPDPKKYLEFLYGAVDKEDIPIIQEIDGSCLMTKNPIKNGFLFIGPKDSRKTTKCLITMKVVGKENCSSVPGHMYGDRFSISGIYRKTANITPECTQHTWKQINIFKALTGGDPVQMEKKFSDPFPAINTATMIQGTNEFPRLDNTDIVTKQRWIVVEFPHRIAREDMNLDIVDEICTEDEMERIISWSMKGLKRLLKNKEYSVSKKSRALWKEWFRETEPLGTWLRENIVVDESAPNLFKRDLYNRLPNKLQRKYTPTEVSWKVKAVFNVARDVHKWNPEVGYSDSCWVNLRFRDVVGELFDLKG